MLGHRDRLADIRRSASSFYLSKDLVDDAYVRLGMHGTFLAFAGRSTRTTSRYPVNVTELFRSRFQNVYKKLVRTFARVCRPISACITHLVGKIWMRLMVTNTFLSQFCNN